MPIIRSGYAKHQRNGSTRATRKQRAATLAGATLCAICGKPPTTNDPLEADHIHAYADHGDGPLRPAHRSCNRSRGRGAPEKISSASTTMDTPSLFASVRRSLA